MALLKLDLRRWITIAVLAALLQTVALSSAWASHLELGQVDATTNAVGETAAYTVTFRIGGGNGNLAAGEPTIRITFPTGYDVSGAGFDAAASGVRDGDSGAFNPFPAHSGFDVDAAARQVFIRDIDHATIQGTTMFQVIFTGVENATTSGNGSVGVSVLNSSGGTNTNGSVSFALANGPLATFSVTDTAEQPIADQAAGQPFDVQVRALDAFGNLVNGTAGGDTFDGTVDLSSNVAGTSGLATTAAFTAGNLASHSVTLTETSDGAATLTATNTDGSESGTSSPFTVTHGPAHHVAITSQPSDTAPGSVVNPAVEIEIRDEFGNRVLSDSGTTVTASLVDAPDGAVLGGATSRDTTDGVATFDDLAIQPAAADYVLRFSAAGFDPVDSDTFDIGHPVPDVAIGPTTSTEDGFVFEVTNHDDRYLYSVESDAGSAAIDANGQVTVTGLDPGAEATVTVTAAARPGSSDLGAASASVTGMADPAEAPEETTDAPDEVTEAPDEVTEVVEEAQAAEELPETGLSLLLMLLLAIALIAAGLFFVKLSPAERSLTP